MEHNINEDVLCILRYKEDKIIIDYEPIKQHFSPEYETIKKLCEESSDNLIKISEFLRITPSLKLLEKHYQYCVKLDGSYQGVTVNIDARIKSIMESSDLLYLSEKNSDEYNLKEAILGLQDEVHKDFKLWISAYNIEKAYRKCYDDKTILTFSHRINGWSNPVYQLSDNFTVELKTNFGYGRASYFYIKIKYKNIEITPVSEWINYELAQFSEIIKYTKSFAHRRFAGIYNGRRIFKRIIENQNWIPAMEFTKDACNCSIKSEIEFIQNYIVEECEKMVSGLENILVNSEFTFFGEQDSHYKVDKKGHQLMEFRGEKISGALDFIIKILEFDKIAEIKSFIARIETCNRKVQPMLVDELKIIKAKLTNLELELTKLNPKYLAVVEKNNFYLKQKNEIQRQMIISKQIDPHQIDTVKVHLAFTNKYPEFNEFEKEFQTVSNNYKILNEQIANMKLLFDNITIYNNKIAGHFRA